MKSRLGQSDEPEVGGEGATPYSNVILINIRENEQNVQIVSSPLLLN